MYRLASLLFFLSCLLLVTAKAAEPWEIWQRYAPSTPYPMVGACDAVPYEEDFTYFCYAVACINHELHHGMSNPGLVGDPFTPEYYLLMSVQDHQDYSISMLELPEGMENNFYSFSNEPIVPELLEALSTQKTAYITWLFLGMDLEIPLENAGESIKDLQRECSQ